MLAATSQRVLLGSSVPRLACTALQQRIVPAARSTLLTTCIPRRASTVTAAAENNHLSMPKRKQDVESSPEADVPLKKTKPKKAKEPEFTEPFVDKMGWNIHPPSLIYRAFEAVPGKKIAAFDFDGTLVNTKSGSQFARSAADWKLFNKKVPKLMKQFCDEGYSIVIFSNQGGVKSKLVGPMADKVKERVQQVVAKLEVPATVLLATLDDDFRKPGTGMWDFFCEHLNGDVKPDLKGSFFVGDAAGREADPETGRPKDFSDSDKNFAAAVGLAFKSPEEVFGEMDGKRALPTPPAGPDGKDAVNHNQELTDIFMQLASHYDAQGDKFKPRAFLNVSTALKVFPAKITDGNLKEVGKLKGVGKASIGIIKEYLDTGKCSVLEDAGEDKPEGGAGGSSGKPSKPSAAKSMAEAFM